MEQMYEDGLADKEGRLTVAGKIYARVLKDYKNSSMHIYIRNLRIGSYVYLQQLQIGDGRTADVIRFEEQTGLMLGR